MRSIRRYGGVAILLALGGCAAPDLGARPEIASPDRYASTAALAGSSARWPDAAWWRGYGDPQLDALIGEALAGSPDIAIAAARVRAAEGVARQAGAAVQPFVTGEGSAGLTKQSYNAGIPRAFVPSGWNDTGRVALNAGLDLDLFGRNRASLVAATSAAQAARLDREQAALVLASDIAAAYADLARLYSLRDVLVRALEVRTQTQRLVADRLANGLETQGELKQAQSAVPASRAELAANAEQIALTGNRIAALIGAGPDRARTLTRPAVTALPADLPADAGIALAGRRPDLLAARARVEAAASRIKVARADFYPDIRLSGLFGLQSLGLDVLANGGSTIGSVGPAITLPIFNGGRIDGRYREVRADYDEAVATYDRTLLNALREVADAVTSRGQAATQVADAREALTGAEGAYRIAQLRYRGGLSTFLNVLSTEQAVLTARRTLAELDARRFAIDVQLVRALGGGYLPSHSGNL